MGGFFGKAMEKLFGTKSKKILMIGLTASGKTTILHQLKLWEEIATIPTIG